MDSFGDEPKIERRGGSRHRQTFKTKAKKQDHFARVIAGLEENSPIGLAMPVDTELLMDHTKLPQRRCYIYTSRMTWALLSALKDFLGMSYGQLVHLALVTLYHRVNERMPEGQTLAFEYIPSERDWELIGKREKEIDLSAHMHKSEAARKGLGVTVKSFSRAKDRARKK